MNNFKPNTQQSGFTIIELLVATAVFSFAFGMIAVGFIEITQLYRQGISIRNVEQSSRFLVDELVRSTRPASELTYTEASDKVADYSQYTVEYSKGQSGSGVGDAITQTTYCFRLQDENNDSSFGDLLRFDNFPGENCTDLVTNNLSSAVNYLEGNIRLLDFTVNSIDSKSAKIELSIGIGEKDILESAGCKDGPGRQYCAVSDVKVAVTARGGSN